MMRLRCLISLIFLLVACFQALAAPEPGLEDAGKKLERILLDNIIEFWYPSTLDRELGGYRLNHDIDGLWKGPAPKTLVTQARTVWFFSRLMRSQYARGEYLEAAKHGYQFLSQKLWDSQNGGFYWEVDAEGEQATKPEKHLYGQSFGLYALSEYGIASGDSTALRLARELFQLLEEKAHDPEFGGYREHFRSDWSSPDSESENYMRVGPDIKLMNTHLHLMEAVTTYYLATRDPVARERLIELIQIQSNAVVRKQVGACTDKYQRNWLPKRGGNYDVVSYGHDVENVWLLFEACKAAGLTNGPLLDLYQTLSEYSLKFGFDWEEGGFYDRGGFGREADRRTKVWWVQAEGLVGTLRMFQITGDPKYEEAFLKTLRFVEEEMADWKGGDWFASISEQGQASGEKAGPWKSPYHNGRAMLECLEILSELDRTE